MMIINYNSAYSYTVFSTQLPLGVRVNANVFFLGIIIHENTVSVELGA